jgi:uncharacterized membrane protein
MNEFITRSTSKTGRVVFVDQARALAIVLMLFGHSFDRFLGEPWRSGQAYSNYQFFRGISSALFILLAGFSFSIATLPKFGDYLHMSPKLRSRVRRIGLILGLGFVLQLWAPTLHQSILSYSQQNIEHLFAFNVLQNIGFSLALLHLLLLVVRQPHRFIFAAGFGGLGIFCLSTITYLPAVDRVLPLPIAAMVNLYHQSLFPLVPFAGYALLGAVLGACYLEAIRANTGKMMMSFTALLGLGLVGVELLLRHSHTEIFPFTTPKAYMPGFTLARAGTAMVLLVGLYSLSNFVTVLAQQSRIMSVDSLSIYFLHLFVVYGCASYPGFLPEYTRSMAPIQMWAWNLVLLGSMYALAKVIGSLRSTRPEMLTLCRHIALLALAINFVAAPRFHIVWVLLSLCASILLLAGARKAWSYVI